MSDSGWPPGLGLIDLAETDSTNAHAARLAPTLAGPVWILAARQTAARGRRGRAWIMPPGNLAATLALPLRNTTAASAALRSFVAALALYDAFAAIGVPTAALALKWPNDVLLNGGKVAGILLESGGQAGRLDWLAVGFGINLIAAPPPDAVEPGATPPVSLLAETGLRPDRRDVVAALARAFARHEATLATQGFAPLRQLWLQRAARLGQPVTARTMSDTVTGTFETLDDGGALVLNTAQGRRRIPAADVYFLAE